MKIEIAPFSGFCFGVDRAVKETFRLPESDGGRKVYTIGNLIHNPDITRRLEERGVGVIGEKDLDAILESANGENRVHIVIRAHGVTKDVYEKLAKKKAVCPFFDYTDCTCPNVKVIHRIAEEKTGPQTLLIIVGNAEHPEVIGIRSFSKGETVVLDSEEELRSFFSGKIDKKELILVSQTTQNTKKWRVFKNFIKKLYTNTLVFDTICKATEKRQSETEELSERADVMLVIGGKNSSNTAKLFEIAKSHCPDSYLIESARELSSLPCLFPDELPKIRIMGITAGASTPSGAIEEVVNKMAELNETITPASTEATEETSFESMLEDSLKTLNTGDIVEGYVSSITPNEIHVDLGTKVTGIIPFDEITDNASDKLEEMFKIGDKIEARVTRVSDVDGVATLSKKRCDAIRNWAKIVEYSQSGEIVEGKVTDIVKGGAVIVVDGVRIFIPAFHTGFKKDADYSVLRGTTQKVKIYEINEQRHRAYASIRLAEREIREAKQAEFWSTIEPGKVYTGKVKSIMKYGVFVDLGGADGMVHTSELSWRRVSDPSKIVSLGDELTVVVKSVDTDDKGKKRISLTVKTPENDPWVIFNKQYKKGDTCRAKIVNLMPFGAFAEVVPGLDGLIHISQLSDKQVNHPSEVVKGGDEVDVKIIDIDEAGRKLSLSILALMQPELPEEAPAGEAAPAEAPSTEQQ